MDRSGASLEDGPDELKVTIMRKKEESMEKAGRHTEVIRRTSRAKKRKRINPPLEPRGDVRVVADTASEDVRSFFTHGGITAPTARFSDALLELAEDATSRGRMVTLAFADLGPDMAEREIVRVLATFFR